MNTRRLQLIKPTVSFGSVEIVRAYDIVFVEAHDVWVACDSRGAGDTLTDPSLPNLLARLAAIIAVGSQWPLDPPPTIEDVREGIRAVVRRALATRFTREDVAALTEQSLRSLDFQARVMP